MNQETIASMDTNLFFLVLLGIGIGIVVNVCADWLPKRLWQADEFPCHVVYRLMRWISVEASIVALVLYSHAVTAPGASLLQSHTVQQKPWLQDTFLYASCGVLLLIAVIDLEHRKVPNVLVGGTLALGIGIAALFGPQDVTVRMILGGIVGLGVFGLVAGLRQGGMGMGDVKLAGLIGGMVGYPYVFIALSIGIIAGGIGSLLLVLSRRINLNDSLAYAPFLCIGALITLWHGATILAWYSQRFI
ncbi:MAG: prepilin peptidase [Gammaproteobacteria bacterium]|nr:MAG: prepilin peptidase [Gammaproteobacteria bacterium]